jgi:hypothetical protein
MLSKSDVLFLCFVIMKLFYYDLTTWYLILLVKCLILKAAYKVKLIRVSQFAINSAGLLSVLKIIC